MKMAKDAAQGMAWLHGGTPVCLHRDFKTSNLLCVTLLRSSASLSVSCLSSLVWIGTTRTGR